MKKAINIAVCGVVPHMGTTTTAFQIMGYLSIKGLDVAYIDIKGSNYIDNISRLYSGVGKFGKGIKYEDYMMYKSILDVEDQYDYVIKDYGCISDKGFNKVSFFEQDIQIVVCGIKANEIFEITDILKNSEFDKAKFCFNFVPFEQRDDVLIQMENRKDNCIFLSYSPDPFVFDGSNTKNFRLIIDNIKDESKKKKFNIVKVFKAKIVHLLAYKSRLYYIGVFLLAYTVLLFFIFRGR